MASLREPPSRSASREVEPKLTFVLIGAVTIPAASYQDGRTCFSKKSLDAASGAEPIRSLLGWSKQRAINRGMITFHEV